MIIGITGRTGVGKTRLSEELSRKLNAKTLIHGDKIMIDVLLSHKRFLKALYGKKLFDGNQLNLNLLTSNPVKVMIVIKALKSEMVKRLLRLYRKNDELVIIEWFLLPVLKKIWKQCDIKVLICPGDRDVRVKNLKKRRNQYSRAFEKFENKRLVTLDNIAGIGLDYSTYDVVLINRYDKKSIEDASNKISQLIR